MVFSGKRSKCCELCFLEIARDWWSVASRIIFPPIPSKEMNIPNQESGWIFNKTKNAEHQYIINAPAQSEQSDNNNDCFWQTIWLIDNWLNDWTIDISTNLDQYILQLCWALRSDIRATSTGLWDACTSSNQQHQNKYKHSFTQVWLLHEKFWQISINSVGC